MKSGIPFRRCFETLLAGDYWKIWFFRLRHKKYCGSKTIDLKANDCIVLMTSYLIWFENSLFISLHSRLSEILPHSIKFNTSNSNRGPLLAIMFRTEFDFAFVFNLSFSNLAFSALPKSISGASISYQAIILETKWIFRHDTSEMRSQSFKDPKSGNELYDIIHSILYGLYKTSLFKNILKTVEQLEMILKLAVKFLSVDPWLSTIQDGQISMAN